MFPGSDFHFMVAGIATFAATVGYTYARKHSTTTSAGLSDNGAKDSATSRASEDARGKPLMAAESSNVLPAPPARRESLKRKEPHDGFEEDGTQDLGYPYNLANIYPRKRCRTPSTDNKVKHSPIQESTTLLFSEDSSAQEDWVFIQHISSPSAVLEEPPRTPSPPATEVTDSPVIVPALIHATESTHGVNTAQGEIMDNNSVISNPTAKQPEPETVGSNAQEIQEAKQSDESSAPTFTPRSMTSSFQKPTSSQPKARGFAEFAGTESPFGSFALSQGPGFKPNNPIWLSTLGAGKSAFEASTSPFKDKDETDGSNGHVIAQATPAAKPVITHVTGEENEDVEMELKGVKLFVKRGDKPFAEGMTGHIKLLSDRTTLDERLLFRREPLWKVSMNVRINPTVRCTYDLNEHVLRIITQERPTRQNENSEDEENPLEVVIYAMKPGRQCSKQDFKEFSETLMKNSRLKQPTASNFS